MQAETTWLIVSLVPRCAVTGISLPSSINSFNLLMMLDQCLICAPRQPPPAAAQTPRGL